jgi:hypothetical protein
MLATVAARHKRCNVFCSPHTGIMGANPAWGMDMRLHRSVPVLSSVGTGLAVGRYPVTGVLPVVYDVKQQSSEIDAVALVRFGAQGNSSRILLFHLVTARGYWKESSHTKNSFVAALRVNYVFRCCDWAENEHKMLFSTRKTATEIHNMPDTIHGNEAVFLTRVYEMFNGFRGRWENLEGGPWIGWLPTAQNPRTVAKFVHW